MKTLNIYLPVIISIIISQSFLNAQETSFTDSRDGQQYKIIYVGKQVWMGQNLNFESENSWVYENKKRNANQYGRLYTFDAAKNACPAGWHLPTENEWQELINFYGGDLEAGLALRIDGPSEFNADYGGFMSKDGEFFDLGHDSNFWTAKNCDEQDAWRCYIDRGFNTIVQDYYSKSGGLSVRCIRNIDNLQNTADNDI